MRAVLSQVSGHPTIVELLDPLGWAGQSIAAGDRERRKATIFDIPVRRAGEGFDIPDEVHLHELDCFVMVIQLLFVSRFLGSKILGEVMGAGFGGDDESVDDGSVSVSREVVTGDGAANGAGGHLSEGEEVVGGSCGSCRY